MSITGGFTGQGVRPQVASAAQSGTGSLRVTFSEEMNPNAALSNPSNYTISGPTTITVTAVAPENLVDPIYVDLSFDTMPTLGIDNYAVTVSSSLSDLAGNTMNLSYLTAQFSGWVRDATSTCFEDSLPPLSALDTLLLTRITGRPYSEQLRRILLQQSTAVGNQQSAARTILWYATATDLRAVNALVADVTEADDIQLCYRSNAVTLDAYLDRYASVLRGAAEEVLRIVGEQIYEPVGQYLNCVSPVYRISAASTLVILAATAEPLVEN